MVQFSFLEDKRTEVLIRTKNISMNAINETKIIVSGTMMQD